MHDSFRMLQTREHRFATFHTAMVGCYKDLSFHFGAGVHQSSMTFLHFFSLLFLKTTNLEWDPKEREKSQWKKYFWYKLFLIFFLLFFFSGLFFAIPFFPIIIVLLVRRLWRGKSEQTMSNDHWEDRPDYRMKKQPTQKCLHMHQIGKYV